MVIPDNPAYRLYYQLDEMEVVNVQVAIGQAMGLKASFVRIDHGTYAPFAPLLLSMQ
jgi:hypothetical protein